MAEPASVQRLQSFRKRTTGQLALDAVLFPDSPTIDPAKLKEPLRTLARSLPMAVARLSAEIARGRLTPPGRRGVGADNLVSTTSRRARRADERRQRELRGVFLPHPAAAEAIQLARFVAFIESVLVEERKNHPHHPKGTACVLRAGGLTSFSETDVHALREMVDVEFDRGQGRHAMLSRQARRARALRAVRTAIRGAVLGGADAAR